MADRRMFSKKIIDTDLFLDMPSTARLLYYDLAMRADDEGFIGSPKAVMRATGASNDDMNVLIMRNFVIPFDSGVVVIRHWRIHNYIQSDRFKPTQFTAEKAQLSEENGVVSKLDTQCIQSVSKVDTQVRLELGKSKVNTIAHPKMSDAFDRFWKAYPRKVGKGDARKAFDKVKVPVDTLIKAVEAQKASAQWKKDGGSFIPYPATWLRQCRWEDEIDNAGRSSRNTLMNYREEGTSHADLSDIQMDLGEL